MFIKNWSNVKNIESIRTNKIMADHLIKNGFHLLSRVNDKFYFSKGNGIEEFIDKSSLLIKLLGKVVK